MGNPGNPGNPLVNAVPSKVNRVKLLGNPGNPVNTEKTNVVRQRLLTKVNTVPSKVNTLSTVEIDHSAGVCGEDTGKTKCLRNATNNLA